MAWYRILALIGGLSLGCGALWLLARLKSVTLGDYSARLAASVFALLGYYVLPTGWLPANWLPTPISVWLRWLFPSLLGILVLYSLLRCVRDHKGQFGSFIKQNARVLVAVLFLIGSRALIGLSGL